MESHIERLWDIHLFLGRPRPLGECLSLCGQWLGAKFSLLRISSREVIQWWVSVVCAIVEGRLWITSWFIVVWLPSCEIVYSGCLGLSGFHQRRFLIYHVGSNVEDQIHIYVWCGLYRGKSAYFRRCGVHLISIASTLHWFYLWVAFCIGSYWY